MLDILQPLGFDPTIPARIVRHQETLYGVNRLQWIQWLDLYQSYQSKPRFHNVKQIISFYGLPGNRGAFYGVFRVLGHRAAAEGPVPAACEWSLDWQASSSYFYELQRDPRFDELRDRMIIDWGPGTRSWAQRLAGKPVLEIREPGRHLPPFEDFLEFSLTFGQLQALFQKRRSPS